MEADQLPPPGDPTDLGWFLSCSGVHPEAVKIVEAFQGENTRLRETLRKIRDGAFDGQHGEWWYVLARDGLIRHD
jgi:hypothetical protein